jgi:hypothetical protein
MTPRSTFRPAVLAFAGLFALSACGDREPEAPATDGDMQAATAPAADDALPPGPLSGAPGTAPMTQAPAIRVTGMALGNTLGENNRVATEMTTFAPNDTIHASVRTDGDGGGVSARWLYQDGQVVHTEDLKVPAGAQTTSFRVDNPDGWPAGTYTVEIMVDGQVVQTREFEVR